MRTSRALGLSLTAGLGLGFAMWRGRLRRFEVGEDSMEPALHNGDYLVATRLMSAPLRGDVVVFPRPGSPEFLMIKRVIGLPGETLVIEQGKTYANGHVLAEPWALGTVAERHDWRLDGKHLIVLSDNRRVPTEDSRVLGPVLMADLWRVGFRYWPPRRIGLVA